MRIRGRIWGRILRNLSLRGQPLRQEPPRRAPGGKGGFRGSPLENQSNQYCNYVLHVVSFSLCRILPTFLPQDARFPLLGSPRPSHIFFHISTSRAYFFEFLELRTCLTLPIGQRSKSSSREIKERVELDPSES